MPQKIFIIEFQLLQTRPSDIGQLQFHFARRSARFAAFGNILHAAARRLNHLVMSPAALWNIAVAEAHRNVVNKLRDLKAF